MLNENDSLVTTDAQLKKIIEYYEEKARLHGVSSKATLQDDYMRELEIETASQWLNKEDRVLDVCCGNGITTVKLARFCKHILGIDLSKEMIRNGMKLLKTIDLQNVEFQVGDVLSLEPWQDQFNTVISIRGLINLPSWEMQKNAIKEIHRILPEGGKYIFIEGWKEGLQTINTLRREFGLNEIPMPWHNLHFSEPELEDFMKNYFVEADTRDLSIYFLISRVLYPAAVFPEEPNFSHFCNKMAKSLVQFAKAAQPCSLILCKLFIRK
ncbi:MAG: class I SAM-dependent methyltransferase [candidate division KSB1 bacterium]|nr:class I SAM-dependent methyltransferase [candidate division KSB1 bacterium]